MEGHEGHDHDDHDDHDHGDEEAEFATLSSEDLPAIAVCHKGLLRAALSLATDWDMIDDPPEKLREPCAHLYEVRAGKLYVKQLNITLTSS